MNIFGNFINQEGISTEQIKVHNELRLIGNRVSDNLFYTLTHTPLPIQGIAKSGYKVVICMSGHDFSIKGKKMFASGLIVRDNKDSVQNVKSILDNNDEGVVLVSQITKKYLDRETLMQNYKSRIFCLLQGKQGITNKLPGSLGKITKVHIRR